MTQIQQEGQLVWVDLLNNLDLFDAGFLAAHHGLFAYSMPLLFLLLFAFLLICQDFNLVLLFSFLCPQLLVLIFLDLLNPLHFSRIAVSSARHISNKVDDLFLNFLMIKIS